METERVVEEVTLDEQGRIVIPASLQTRLGLSPGTTLVVEKRDGDEVFLRVVERAPALVDKDGVLVVKAEPVGDLQDVVRPERNRLSEPDEIVAKIQALPPDPQGVRPASDSLAGALRDAPENPDFDLSTWNRDWTAAEEEIA